MILPITARADVEGRAIPCPVCKGLGKVTHSTGGFFSSQMIEEDCPSCHGAKEVCLVTTCIFKSGPVTEMLGGSGGMHSSSPFNAPCIGVNCIAWDPRNGGCMKRKALLKYLYREIP